MISKLNIQISSSLMRQDSLKGFTDNWIHPNPKKYLYFSDLIVLKCFLFFKERPRIPLNDIFRKLKVCEIMLQILPIDISLTFLRILAKCAKVPVISPNILIHPSLFVFSKYTLKLFKKCRNIYLILSKYLFIYMMLWTWFVCLTKLKITSIFENN